MAQNANFAATPRQSVGQVTAANTARDGTGTTVNIFSGGASGSRVDRIRVRATGTTTAGVVRIFYSPDNGVSKRLLAEIMVTAATPSTTVQAFQDDLVFPGGFQLPGNVHQLWASTHNAETFNVFAEGGDY